MNRFPNKYVKPILISLSEGLNTGWSAVCQTGASPSTATLNCTIGGNPSHKGGDGFIDPEILQQGL